MSRSEELAQAASMSEAELSDSTVLDLLRRQGSLGIAELAEATGVTATAVRQRLNRLMGRGYVGRQVLRTGRGRPSHRYSLTEEGRRAAGNNYADLALALWNEVRAIEDPEVRRGLISRLAGTLAAAYGEQVRGATVESRLQSLASLFAARDIPLRVEKSETALPVLTADACPYPELAETDHTICAMERLLFSQVVGHPLQLTSCRLDGASCCTFQPR